MRASDSSTIDALVAAREHGLVPRSLVTIWATPLDGGPAEQFAFWDGQLPVDISVIGGRSGVPELRSFAADGAITKVSSIRLTTDLTIRPATVSLNPLHDRVAALMGGYSIRLAPVEIHRVPLDAQTRLLVAPPRCRFVGLVETAKRARPKAGEEGSLTLNCVSDTVQLTRTNPAKRSDETQRLRSGDRMMRYAAVAHEWEIFWGEKSGSTGS